MYNRADFSYRSILMKLKIKTCRFGEPRKRGEGLRIGTVRYLPRGVKKVDLANKDYFDIWFPTLAPSKELIKSFKEKIGQGRGADKGATDKEFAWFAGRYRCELKNSPEARHATGLLNAMAELTPITIGCYCADIKLCHRSILLDVIKKAREEG
jgi:uncharacterized protein YeaO (DUF488 family)